MSAPANPGRLPIIGWLCLIVGVALLNAAVYSSVMFARSMIERSHYASAALCLEEPVGDCWVEVEATVVGKRVDSRSILVDDHVLELNEVGGQAIVLADGSGLWAALGPGESVTLQLWRGHVVHARAKGHQADTVDNPRVGTQRLYASSLVALGLGGMLSITGFGWLGMQRRQGTGGLRRHPAFQWTGRVALAAAVVGAVGLGAEVYTRAAPLPMVTLLGVGALAAVAAAVRLARARLVRQQAAA